MTAGRHDPEVVSELHLTSQCTSWPIQLADLHGRTSPSSEVTVQFGPWSPTDAGLDLTSDLIVGAGFEPSAVRPDHAGGGRANSTIRLRRCWSLPDTVAPGMTVLICGLNPSPASADRGVGFGRPGNRFWPAAVEAGLVSQAFDSRHALTNHGVGMTDLVKRTTRRAAELATDEYRDGLARVERLIRWLQPRQVCFVGLAGWRAVKDRQAVAGWQSTGLGDRPLYLMPSTSGLNAHAQLPDLVAHLRQAGVSIDT